MTLLNVNRGLGAPPQGPANPYYMNNPTLPVGMYALLLLGHYSDPQPKKRAALVSYTPTFAFPPPANSFNYPQEAVATRRVWVKTATGPGAPTTIIVHDFDIVDDLKLAVINKFPNTLGRYFDPADITIKLDFTSRQHKREDTPSLVLPDGKTPQSPQVGKPPAQLYRYVNLEPDQNVFLILDSYYPNGMSMPDAFLIEVSLVAPPPPPPQPKLAAAAVFYHQNKPQFHSPQPQHVKLPQFATLPQHRLSPIPNNPGVPESRGLPTNPRHSPMLAPPQHLVLHRRSQSIPPQSPALLLLAVLLLPRNFSLNSSNEPSKRPETTKIDTKAGLPRPEAYGKHDVYDELGKPLTKEMPTPRPPLPMPLLPEDAKLLDVQRGAPPLTLPLDTTTPLKITRPNDIAGELVLPQPVRPKATKNPSQKQLTSKSLSNKDKVLPSILVLVVEDNAINQAILGAFLRKHKIHYQIAKNGQEAIDKWRKGGFHLVLMDIQLPVKLGIEATKEIRRLEKINRIGVFAQDVSNHKAEVKDEERLDLSRFRSPVIIVALTASLNSSVDRQNALMAGCNDFLTKPVNLVWLQNKITEWGCMQALIDFDWWKAKRRQMKGKDPEGKK